MKIHELVAVLERRAPRSLQEDYDNSGLQVGDPEAEVSSALVCLDCTEAVVEEAARHGCGLIISHHPVIFKGLKSLVSKTYVERTVLAAIRHNIALYAIHTNLDNVLEGVNGEIANALGLRPLQVLDPKPGQVLKLMVFVPRDHAEALRNALFQAGAGAIGAYDECSFNTEGTGTFRGGEGTNPFVGQRGDRHHEPEVRVEVVLRPHLVGAVTKVMREVHPYEEVAFDIYPMANELPGLGSGLLGEWDHARSEAEFLASLKSTFNLSLIRHTRLLGRPIRRVALCGGSGAFLLNRAITAGADAFITGDLKYHQFFDADGRLVLADIGHYGSEQFTPRLVRRWIGEHLSTFAVRLAETVTDPIYHY